MGPLLWVPTVRFRQPFYGGRIAVDRLCEMCFVIPTAVMSRHRLHFGDYDPSSIPTSSLSPSEAEQNSPTGFTPTAIKAVRQKPLMSGRKPPTSYRMVFRLTS